MDSLMTVDGRVRSGHFIFIRDSDVLSDEGFLEALGLVGYTRDMGTPLSRHIARILRAGDWAAYADDWSYTAYNSTGIKAAIARLGQDNEVLRIAIGDADESFEFYHFFGGSLRRAFHFYDYAGKSSVILNSGPPLRCESAFQLGSDPWPYMWVVADEIGIDSRAMAASISTYSKPCQRS